MNTTEERRLSEWLHTQTPQPPRQISAGDITARDRRAPTPRRWVPVLAAAGMVLAITGPALVAANWPHRSHPAASATTSTAQPSQSATPSPSSSVPAGMSVGPWNATTVGGAVARARPLAGDRNSLYVTAPDGKAILRIAPGSGAVLAKRSYPADAPISAGIDKDAVIVADALWTAYYTGSGDTVTVRGLDLATLAPVASITVQLPGVHPPGHSGPPAYLPLHGNAKAGRLYIGARHTIVVIDATTRRVIHKYQITGAPITDLAANPGDTRLYITQQSVSTTESSLTVVDPNNGTALAKPTESLNGGAFIAATSAGGVWVSVGSGMSLWMDFVPASNSSQPRWSVTDAGGGFIVSGTATSRVVWLGGTSKLACADPVTGKVRVSARMPDPYGVAANISGLTVAAGHLFGYYQADAGPSNLLIKLSPPARCTS